LSLVIAASAWIFAAQSASLSPDELVRRTVQNEVQASNSTANYAFRERKETPRGSQIRLMVETRDAMVGMLIAVNDRPIGPEQRQAEYLRVERFIKNPEELKRKQKQEKEDSDRIMRIVKALPTAFLYENDGTDVGKPGIGRPGSELVRLKFRPNPDYDPPSRVEQVLTGMQGTLLIDPEKERIARIDGSLAKDVSFGWGILGHLDRGGHFLVEQGDVDNGTWEITKTDLAITGRILLFKSINFKSTEVYSGFHPVPTELTFAQGVELLKKKQAVLAENEPSNKNSQ
jgi:hypothetical protein